MRIDYKQIDKSIIPLIKLLNEKGYTTNGSCSGLYKDHKDNNDVDWDDDRGYLTFSILSDEQKEYLRKISSNCCLKFIESYGVPCYRFASGSKDCFLIESFLCSCRIQNFVPIVNLKPKNQEITNITLDILSEEMSDIVINDRWKRLYKVIDK